MKSATRTYASQLAGDPQLENRRNLQTSMMDIRIAEARAALKAQKELA